jgi:hypothetical protein
MSDIFISYARKDQPKVKALADALTASGWSVWWDPKIQSGKEFDRVIENALANAKCVLVVWSKQSANSDWVRAEAANGLTRGILISVAIEEGITLPLRFSQVQTEDFSGWNGEISSQAFQKLTGDIASLVENSGASQTGNGELTQPPARQLLVRDVLLAGVGMLLTIVSAGYFLQSFRENHAAGITQRIFYLTLSCVSVSALLFGLTGIYAHVRRKVLPSGTKFAGPVAGFVFTLLAAFFLSHSRNATHLTIRVLDENKKPVTEGRVKLDLPRVNEQLLNNAGEVNFGGLSEDQLTGRINIRVSSPGYNDHQFDTVLVAGQSVDLLLKRPAVVKVSGTVKDAGEAPIRNVEISVENTRFYTHTLNNGTYTLNLKTYVNGDEIILRTSHPAYEDKLVHLTVQSPETQVPDIVLKPIN